MQATMQRASAVTSNPFLGNRMTYRVAPAPAPSSTAFRQVTTMAKKKGVRIIVTLECTEARGLGETPSRYCTQKVIGPCQLAAGHWHNREHRTAAVAAAAGVVVVVGTERQQWLGVV